jgi:DNA adenine methylase
MISLQQNILSFDSKLITTNNQRTKPFLKWAGGKTQLLKDLHLNLPKKKFNIYYEPFLGSGALFFSLLPNKSVLNDSNEELINCYKVIRDELNKLIEDLNTHQDSEEYYYYVRSLNPEEMDDIQRASRLIYLNRTCFNGLYRVNKSGKFNTPYGKYKNPNICNTPNLKNVSDLLKNVTLVSTDFEKATKLAQKGDFLYFDPPYLPVSKYSDFKRYTKEFFYENDHIRLSKIFKELDRRGCYVMASNSNTELIHNLYKGFNIKTVLAKRLINKTASKRGAISELLITNY